MENKTKTYLGSDYHEENPVLNWAVYWAKDENTSNKSNAWRMENELDCLYLNTLAADTIISMYHPITRVIECLNPEIKLGGKKELVKLLLDKEKFEQLLPKDDLLVKQLQVLASKAQLLPNFMKLKDRQMQNRGFFMLMKWRLHYISVLMTADIANTLTMIVKKLRCGLSKKNLECSLKVTFMTESISSIWCLDTLHR